MESEAQKALVVIVWSPKPGSPDRKVLLLRLNPDRGGYWQTITGKIEPNETQGEGALREANEETGLAFARSPQFLGLEQKFPSRWGGEAREKAFFLPIFGGSAPPTPRLDGKEHDSFEWLSPQEAAAKVKWPFNRQAIERATSGQPPLLLSKRGIFFQDGEEICHERTVELFHRSLNRENDGGFTVSCGGEVLEVILEDNPRYVKSFDRESGQLTLSDGKKEKLRPSTLRIRKDNSLTCTLENGWSATFLSSAYYEISKDVRELHPGKYVLNFLGSDYELLVAN